MSNSGPSKTMHVHHPIPINTNSNFLCNTKTNKSLLFLPFPSLPRKKKRIQRFEMAKMCKLTKLKSAIKRWPSLTRVTSRSSSTIAAANYDHDSVEEARIPRNDQLRAVFVGKSRRRYLLSSDIICHPLFQELIERSNDDEEEVVVACEVVLFEHLLWMIEAGGTDQLDSMEELAQFYVLQQ